MAEFIEARCDDMIPQMEQMERLKLFDKDEIKAIANKRQEYEYKVQRHKKNKEDYLRYIQYEMDLLKLVKQRREKFGITAKKMDIDFSIANKINSIFKLAISIFEDDFRFWIAYMAFCKQVKFNSCVSRMIGKMIQAHQDKPKCWHIAAKWEMEENKNLYNAKKYLLAGLRCHEDSQLLYTDLFTLELKQAELKFSETSPTTTTISNNEMPIELEKALIIYKTASNKIKNINYIIELLNIAKNYPNTEKLEHKIVSDIIEKYSNKPQMWDFMARRELEGLSYNEDEKMETENEDEPSSLRDKIGFCNEVYQTGVKRLKSIQMWSLYINCLIEINQDLTTLPNYKRKLLKNALLQAHQSKKLQEKYYLNWIDVLKGDKNDETLDDKIYQVMIFGTEAIPDSVELWRLKLKHLINSGKDELVDEEFYKAIKSLGVNSLTIWQIKLLYYQAKFPGKVEDVFKAGINGNPEISKAMRVPYIEWLLLTKGIEAARQKYQELSTTSPLCLELHKKMADLEVIQSNICKLNARKPYDISVVQFGKTHIEVWLDYIVFEMKYGDPMRVTEIHRQAVKSLEPAKIDLFITEYSLLLANSENNIVKITNNL